MKSLHVLFDLECDLCRSCCLWLARQPAYLELRFIPLQSEEVAHRFPGVEKLDLRERLVVISDEGGVYQGQHAWIMCLYALREYRAWAQRLSHPALLPFAERVCGLISRHRLALSRVLFQGPAEELGQQLEGFAPSICCPGEGGCR